MRENLTSFMKYLLNEARKIQRSLNYKLVWTWQGQIFIRKQDNSRAVKISILRDLDKLECAAMGNRFGNYSKSLVYDGFYLRCFKVTNAL